jgi:hypothetical protein
MLAVALGGAIGCAIAADNPNAAAAATTLAEKKRAMLILRSRSLALTGELCRRKHALIKQEK